MTEALTAALWKEGTAQVPLHDSITCNFMIYQDRLETNLLQLLVNADILASNAARQWLLIAVSRDAGERRHCPSDLSKGGQRRRRCLYHNRIIGNFMAYQDRNETHFLHFLLLFLRRCWTVGNRIGDDFFLVFQKFPSPLIFLMLPLTYRCSGVPVAPPPGKISADAHDTYSIYYALFARRAQENSRSDRNSTSGRR